MRVTVKVALGLLAVVGVAYLFVSPVRIYLSERHHITVEEHTVSVLAAEDHKLAAEGAALKDDKTIAEIARQQYGLVMPGQQAFMVLPPPTKPAHARAANAKPRPSPWYAPLEFWHHL